jgi:hypothetical protein
MRYGASGVSIVPPKLTPDVSESEESEEQYEIVSSFGMFWRRESIEWIATPRLLGMQQIGATPVDFFKQLGTYLLYDGREVIYVGRTTDRPLGRNRGVPSTLKPRGERDSKARSWPPLPDPIPAVS